MLNTHTDLPRHLFAIGFGYVAQIFTQHLQDDGWEVTGSTRNFDKALRMAEDHVDAAIWDGSTDQADASWVADTTAILISTPPTEAGCPALAAFGEAIKAARPQWIGYLSSNGIYGDHQGDWIDETTPPRPSSARGRNRLAAEAAWQVLGEQAGLPVKIFRLPGIYGPGRSAFDSIHKGRARRIVKPGQVFNRMHVADIAMALYRSLSLTLAGGHEETVFNLSDDEPSPPQDVITYACKLINTPPPPSIDFANAELSEMAKSFYADNKRVSNGRMKSILDITLTYPSYREGLRAIHVATQGADCK